MALLNEGASFPTAMWIVARQLVSSPGRRMDRQTLRNIVSPPSLLLPDKQDDDSAFGLAVKTLADLGIVTDEGEKLALTEAANVLTSDDVATFEDLLRRQVLDPGRNKDIADSASQTGPKDLVRALAWFLTLNPYGTMSHADVVQRQHGALGELLGHPFVNDTRWTRFTYWAPALGFATPPLIPPDDKGGQTLVADCTRAVQRTVQATWPSGTRLSAREAVTTLIDKLPVLPGGRYSSALGLTTGDTAVSAALSFALLCGEEYGWLELRRRSDADDDVLLVDPDQASGTRRVTHIEILEPVDD